MKINYDREMEVASELVKRAGRMIRNKLKVTPEYKIKSNSVDLVTQVDKDIELFLIKELTKHFPSYGFLTEETNSSEVLGLGINKYKWVIDPIDGTMNFIHGFERFSISVALYHNEDPILGLVLDVTADKLYSAQKGKGAYCDGEKLKVSRTSNVSESLIGIGFSTEQWLLKKKVMTFIDKFATVPRGIRITGSACLDLVDVASGKLDGFCHYGLSTWDIAAGMIIVDEAGGSNIGADGEENVFQANGIISSNKLIEGDILELLTAHHTVE